jgi:hypothetical protein
LEDSDYCALRSPSIDESLSNGVDPLAYLLIREHGAVTVLESYFGSVGLDGLVDVMTDG